AAAHRRHATELSRQREAGSPGTQTQREDAIDRERPAGALEMPEFDRPRLPAERVLDVPGDESGRPADDEVPPLVLLRRAEQHAVEVDAGTFGHGHDRRAVAGPTQRAQTAEQLAEF